MGTAPETGKKYFTATQANAMLPLVKSIVRDITELAVTLRERAERLRPRSPTATDDMYQEERVQIEQQIEQDQDRMRELIQELTELGVELKDPFTGLIDFPCWMNNHEVYLCWRQGEPSVAHWHEIHAGFAGRQKLMPERGMTPTP
jgi:hypothetical protein